MSRQMIGGEAGWPRVEMPSAQSIIDFWTSHRLPERIMGDDSKPEGQLTLDIVASVVRHLPQHQADRSYDILMPKLEAGETINTNNFWACFSPWQLAYFKTGFWTASEHRLVMPYVIDQDFNNAWTDMCHEMAGDVQVVLEILLAKEDRIGWLEGDEPDLAAKFRATLSRLVHFLAKRGVPLSYLIN